MTVKQTKCPGPFNPQYKGKQNSSLTSGQFPVQETFTMREHTPLELVDRAAKFQQKARESIQAWLMWLYDMGANGISVTRQEAEKMSTITTCLPSCSTCMALGGGGGFKVLTPYTCIILAYREAWPNEGDLPGQAEHWKFIEEVQQILRDLEMECSPVFEGPNQVTFTAGINTKIIWSAPSTAYGTPIFTSKICQFSPDLQWIAQHHKCPMAGHGCQSLLPGAGAD